MISVAIQSPATGTMRGLRPADVKAFTRLRIPVELLDAAQVGRVTTPQAREDFGIRYRSDHLDGIVFPYVDPEDDRVLTARLRRDHPEVDTAGRPIAKYVSPPDPRRLYFPPGAGRLLTETAVPVVMVEAEKSSLALAAAAARVGRPLLVVATGGCWGWRGVIGKTTDANGTRVDEKGPLPDLARITWTDRVAVLLFDANAATNDQVRAARRALAGELGHRGARVQVADVPVESGVNGPDDYLGAHDDAAVFALLDTARPLTGDGGADDGEDSAGRVSQATRIVRLALAECPRLFHDDDVPYVSMHVGSHHETHALRSRGARAWLAGLFFEATGKAPGGQSLADATNTLEAHALRGEHRDVGVRVARTAGAIYLDLGTPEWQVVEITRAGWRVLAAAPVAFRRPRAFLALPLPVPGGSIAELRPFLNLAGEADWVLVVAWLLGALRGRGPYPLLVEQGEQDAGKSSGARLLRTLIDPNRAPLRSEPREPRDLMIAATNAHVLNFDNLSSLSRSLSDDLCRLATGGGFSTRTLYENREEEIFHASRPVIVNGITELATRPDLVSRSLFISFPPLRDADRHTDDELNEAFAMAHPRILGALLDAVAVGLAREATVRLPGLPRMADFARWVVACEPRCPWSAGAFLETYAGNRQGAIDAILEGDVMAELARTLCAEHSWAGTATDLLAELNQRTDESERRRQDWFRRPRQVADALRRLAPALRRSGVGVQFRRAGHGRARVIELERVGVDASAPSAAQTDAECMVAAAIAADEAEDACVASSAGASADPSVFPHAGTMRTHGTHEDGPVLDECHADEWQDAPR